MTAIDIVYTVVDHSEGFNRALSEFQRLAGRQAATESACVGRFANREEMRYSLRSLHAHGDFPIGRIHFLTNGAPPEWLNTNHPQVRVVEHHAVFDNPYCLPTFNSHAIEANLDNIPGLAERFIYFNDDVFLTAFTAEGDLFRDGQLPVVILARSQVEWDPQHPKYDNTVAASYRRTSLTLERHGGPRISYRVAHAPHAIRRQAFSAMKRKFEAELAATIGSRIRDARDVIPVVLYQFLALHARAAAANDSRDFAYISFDADIEAKLARFRRRLRRFSAQRDRPRFLCINDVSRSDRFADGYAAVLQEFLDAVFPEPSPWERF